MRPLDGICALPLFLCLTFGCALEVSDENDPAPEAASDPLRGPDGDSMQGSARAASTVESEGEDGPLDYGLTEHEGAALVGIE